MASPESEKFVAVLLEELRDLRLAKGISQERLSEISGVDLGAISRAERQLRIPSMALIRDLSLGLGQDFPKLCRRAETKLSS